MPLYSFTTPDGREFIEFFHVGQRPETITTPDGVEATYDLGATLRPAYQHPQNEGYPMLCDASGVLPQQIHEFERIGDSKGVDFRFHPDGRAVYYSKEHRDACLKARGLIDRSRYT